MTDKQAFERIEELLKEVQKIANEKEIDINIYINQSDCYANACIGDYEIIEMNKKKYYEYRPSCGVEKWKSIAPNQVNFSSEPHKESAPGGNPNAQIKNNTLKQ